MVRTFFLILLCAVVPLTAFGQLAGADPEVFSSLGVTQTGSQVRVSGTIGQVQIGPIASPTTASANQGFWPQVRQLDLTPTGGIIDYPAPEVPAEFGLQQNYPNPFNPTTTIPFSLARQADAELVIYNTLGQQVRRFDLSAYGPGHYELSWQGTNHAGLPVPSGLYFYRLRTADDVAVARMLLLK